jgi:pimeloyl-ACP methyl ester carboxylesterase
VTRVAIVAMRSRAILLLLLLSAGCTTHTLRIERLAGATGLTRSVVESGGFRSLVFMKGAPQREGDALAVFIDGDGVPWRGGMQPSADPTTGNPIALKLLARTGLSAAYVTRPCYHELLGPNCTPERWTIGRYSEDIVASMAHTVRVTVQRASAHKVLLVGYSGGGALAVLVAERLDNVAGVITVGANLDTQAWTRHHGYVPLLGSLNPALSKADHPWPEIHLYGARDQVVPPSTAAEYFQRHPQAEQRILDEHDHVCCWVEQWPQLWAEIGKGLVTGH